MTSSGNGGQPSQAMPKRYEAAGGRYYVCPICFNARKLDAASLIAGAEIEGTIPMWEWVGDEGATTSATERADASCQRGMEEPRGDAASDEPGRVQPG